MIQKAILYSSCLAMVQGAIVIGAAQTTSQHTTTTHHTAGTTTHHTAVRASRCAVPAPELSPKIPSTPAALGCPKIAYALTYLDTKIGTGELAQPRKWYTVHYTGYLPDGTKFDSSHDHPDGGQPITFPYGAHRVIPGWDTGFEGMRVGGKRRLFIPYQLAYGEMGRPPVIPPRAELIFDVELLGQSDTPPAQPSAPASHPAVPPPARPGMAPGGNSNGGSGTPPPSGSNPNSTAPSTPPAGTPPPTTTSPQP